MSAKLPSTNEVKERRKLIIVDDDEDLLKILMATFQAEGFNVHGISSGKEALEYFMIEKNIRTASLIILDRVLPDMDGIEILKQLGDKYPNLIPVMILSALSSDKDVISGLSKGAVDYIVKPFNLSILKRKVNTLIDIYDRGV